MPGNGAGNAEDTGGVAETMLRDFAGADKVYIVCGHTDCGKG